MSSEEPPPYSDTPELTVWIAALPILVLLSLLCTVIRFIVFIAQFILIAILAVLSKLQHFVDLFQQYVVQGILATRRFRSAS